MPGGTLIGGLIKGDGPKLPKLNVIDAQKEQEKAIAGNQAALPGLEKLGSDINSFSAGELDKMLSYAIPGFSGLKQGVSDNLAAGLKGQFAPGAAGAADAALLRNQNAAYGIQSGTAGANVQDLREARNFGLTAQSIIDKSISSTESWLKSMASIQTPGQFNIASMFVSPEQQIGLDTSERNNKFQYDLQKNIQKYQGSFRYLMGTQVEQDDAMINSMIGSVAGSAGGAAGGGGM